jgi:uncharacterized spore protein YtfJ
MQPPQRQQPIGTGEEEMPQADPVTTFLEALTTGVGVETVFGNPVTAGEQVIIPVAETTISGGAGYGQGPSDGQPQMRTFRVGGGGAGGGAHTRPVAAIVVTAGEVRVQPIVDVGKLALSGIVSAAALWQGVAAFVKSMRKRH